MSGITLSSATRQSLISAQDTAALMSQTQNRLSTGKKVSSALDNPTEFFTAAGLDSRSSDLSALLDGISNGIQTIQAASTGITNIQKLVDSAKSTANQALSTTVSTGGTASAQFGVIKAAVPAVVGVSQAAGKSVGTVLGDGAGQGSTLLNDATSGPNLSLGDSITLNGVTVTMLAAGATTTGAGTASVGLARDASIDSLVTTLNTGFGGTPTQVLSFSGGKFTETGATAATDAVAGTGGGYAKLGLPSTTGAKTAAVTAVAGQDASRKFGTTAQAVTFKVDGKAVNYTITAGESIDDTITGLNAQAGSNIFSKDSATGTKLVVDSSSDVEITDSVTRGALGFAGSGSSQSTDLTNVGEDTRANLATQYNNLLDQIDQLAGDASYNGVNLLNSDDKSNKLHLAFNEQDTSNLDVQGVNAKSAGLGLSKIDITTGGTGNFASNDDIKSTLNTLTSATSTLRSYASTFGSNLTVVQNRQDFTKNLTNVLQTGSSNLVNADLNEEAANSQALSTRQSLAISALSLANTAQQGVLQLLR